MKFFSATDKKHICYILLKIREQNVIIFSCHALTEEKDEEIMDIFYDELK